ncbi:MAG: 2-oxoglutarate dehydrogenase E1 component [Arenicella sp.]|jgi:2-oxoglutarate dehydrogenase E1 component
MDNYSYIANAHGSYIDELYKSYKKDPNSVDESWQKFFEGFDFSLEQYGEDGGVAIQGAVSGETLKKEIAVRELIDAYRTRGHLESTTNPVRKRLDRKAMLQLSDFGLSDKDLDTHFDQGSAIGIGRASLRDIVKALQKIYIGNIGYEYMAIRDTSILDWFKEKIERESLGSNFSIEDKKRILSKLNEAVVFEDFLGKKYLGQKRFSLEGGEAAIPALDTIINEGAKYGLKEVHIGMAHRGRLNILTNTMGKPHGSIFSEFEGEGLMHEGMGDGDVKYHMGYTNEVEASNGDKIKMVMQPNPSHLEAVGPVVSGYVRARLDKYYGGDKSKIISINIHGDAAVAGQGLVYELVQMSRLPAYDVGGTIHFIINNQVGFTTDFFDGRSSIYCTDLSGLVEAPELHVNGDDPEALVFATKLAVEFRQKYQRDVFIDMVCYRRHGHNEADEPKFTQPLLYDAIARHKNPRDIYAEELVKRGDISPEFVKELDNQFRNKLEAELKQVREEAIPFKKQKSDKVWQKFRKSNEKDFQQSPETGVGKEMIDKLGAHLSKLPKGHKFLRQIDRLIKSRKQFLENEMVDWGTAELMAYGSLLLEGHTVRMSGQDVQRGTFSHRHAVLADVKTGEEYFWLNDIEEGQEKKHLIYNSLLSEYAVLGFEYGYANANPEALTIWEAQFGDFANGAQIIIDQFLAASESKWFRMNGLVMLLPHGYEGQGPEHSNARPERFLQLCAEDNMVVTNVTNAANFFHMLRRQVAWEFRKPCIVMTPKSLLRGDLSASPLAELTKGTFQEVIGDSYAKPNNKVTKILLCTGKIYYDLQKYQTENKIKDVAVIRIEQLHPFPQKQLERELKKYGKVEDLKLLWVQEEPTNMGYWTYILRTLFEKKYRHMDVVSRKPSASPATGYKKVHEREQNRIVKAAFDR